MNTRVVEGKTGIAEAAAFLAAGHVVALPTETVYGLAGDALHAGAIARIFEAKERPFFDPLIVHLPGLDWLDRLTNAASDSLVMRLIERYWPGPLTLVLQRRPIVPDIVTAGLPTVAVRMSAHPVFREILHQFGKPVAAPSANRFGRISPTAAGDVLEELAGRIPLIVDGGRCAVGVESTVIAPGEDGLRILRSGPVTAEELASYAPVLSAESMIASPGQLPSHYAPRTLLRLLSEEEEADSWRGAGVAGLLAWSRSARPAQFAAMEVLTPRDDVREAASRLFASMRKLDGLGLDLIVAERPPAFGLGVAILDRLVKAGGPR